MARCVARYKYFIQRIGDKRIDVHTTNRNWYKYGADGTSISVLAQHPKHSTDQSNKVIY